MHKEIVAKSMQHAFGTQSGIVHFVLTTIKGTGDEK